MHDLTEWEQDDFGDFTWSVSTSGYETKELLIVEVPETQNYRTYHPLTDFPSLFLEFAECNLDIHDMLSFANKYGLLKEEVLLDQYSPLGTSADSLELWQISLRTLKESFQMWEAIKINNIFTLSRFVKWQELIAGYNSPCCFSPSTNEPFYQDLAITPFHKVYRRLVKGDVIFPAKIFLQRIVNINLRQNPTTAQLRLTSENDLRQYFSPRNLLGVLWFQFAQAVAGNTKFKQCVHCLQWEDVTYKKDTWKGHPDCANRVRVKRAWDKKHANPS